MPYTINKVEKYAFVWHCCKPMQTFSQRRSPACNSLMPAQNECRMSRILTS